MLITGATSRRTGFGIKRVLLTGIVLLSGLFSSLAIARHEGAPVVIFSDSNFAGEAQQLDVGDYDRDAIAIGNDSLSSLRVAPGYQVTLYKDSNFSGKSRVITADTANLSSFNDATSSIRVERRSRAAAEDAAVVIYADIDYRGRSQQLGNGDYDTDALQIGNDKLSSIRVARGCKVVLFADEHFSGRAKVIASDKASLSDFNDTTSSIQVSCR